jgi:hypothetical protein
VPINLEAILVTQPVLNQYQFSNHTNYKHLTRKMKNPSQPFEIIEDKQKGVHLHWKLPKIFTHGENKNLFEIKNKSIIESLYDNIVPKENLKVAFTNNSYKLSNQISIKSLNNNSWLLSDDVNQEQYLLTIENNIIKVLDAKISYKKVPNRWIITRFVHNQEKIEPISWIIESDFIDSRKGTSLYIDPNAKELNNHAITKIGRSIILNTEWKENTKDRELFLEAVGPSGISFSLFSPDVENVFSFVDSMKKNPTDEDSPLLDENTTITYMVHGWFSNSKYDPLNNINIDEIQSYLDSIKWEIANNIKITSDNKPNSSIYHGILHSLVWQTTKLPNEEISDIPKDIAENINVSIGSTSVEALSAIMKNKAGATNTDTTIFEAFQYGLIDSIDEPDGHATLDDKVKAARYGSSNGGIVWDVMLSQDNKDKIDLEPYYSKIAPLNIKQRVLDEKIRELQYLQCKLYSYWWKSKYLNTVDIIPRAIDNLENIDEIKKAIKDYSTKDKPSDEDIEKLIEIKSLRDSITNLQKEIASIGIPSSSNEKQIYNYAKNILGFPDNVILKPRSNSRFWSINDPVLLVTGMDKYFENSNTKIICRLSEQLVDGLNVDGKIVNSEDIIEYIPKVIENSDIPPIISKLTNELYFIDPTNAPLVAKYAFNSYVSINDVLTAIKTSKYSTDKAVSPDGICINSFRVSWKPLYIEWSINWYPTFLQDNDKNWSFDKDNWSFNGSKYVYNGTNLSSNPLEYTGKTILSNHSTLNFESKINDYIKKYSKNREELKHVDTLLNTIKGWGVLSQRLSGFHDNLITKTSSQTIVPTDPLIGQNYQLAPFPKHGNQDVNPSNTFPYFFPSLGGFFGFNKLSVVDIFGCRIDLLSANGNSSQNPNAFVPIVSEQLKPNNDVKVSGKFSANQIVEQSFGLIQPSRLMMQWVDSENSQKEFAYAKDTNPIAGWIIPNHIEDSILVYSPSGELFGELFGPSKQTPVRWQGIPYSKSSIDTPSKIPNKYLRNMITNIFETSKVDNEYFYNFLKVIDETLWSIEPLNNKSNQNISVLMGRALAIVRMKLELQLDSKPTNNQGWAYTLQEKDGDITTLDYQVKLGSLDIREDGLLGYYSDDNCDIFNSVHYPSAIKSTKNNYIKKIEPNNYISLKPNGKPIYLTMLLDPRGSIHARSGILPTKDIQLPSFFIDKAVKNMELLFTTESLLTQKDRIDIPSLSQYQGEWDWISNREKSNNHSSKISFIKDYNQLPTNINIIDGWLHFIESNKK